MWFLYNLIIYWWYLKALSYIIHLIQCHRTIKIQNENFLISYQNTTVEGFDFVLAVVWKWVEDNCLMSCWWLPDDCQMTARWMPDDCQMTANMTVRWLPDDRQMTTRGPPDDRRWLPDDCQMTARCQPDEFQITFRQINSIKTVLTNSKIPFLNF